MDLALICLGKDVTPEKLEQTEKDSLHKISFNFFEEKCIKYNRIGFCFFLGWGEYMTKSPKLA
jgi:hypothetical protein